MFSAGFNRLTSSKSRARIDSGEAKVDTLVIAISLHVKAEWSHWTERKVMTRPLLEGAGVLSSSSSQPLCIYLLYIIVHERPHPSNARTYQSQCHKFDTPLKSFHSAMESPTLQRLCDIAANSQSAIKNYLENHSDRTVRINALRDAKNSHH